MPVFFLLNHAFLREKSERINPRSRIFNDNELLKGDDFAFRGKGINELFYGGIYSFEYRYLKD